MTKVNSITVVSSVQQKSTNESLTDKKTKDTVQNLKSVDSNLMDAGVKVGLAIAAAVGVGMAIKNGKAAKTASKKLNSLTDKFDNMQKANNETIDNLQKELESVNNKLGDIAQQNSSKKARARKKTKSEPGVFNMIEYKNGAVKISKVPEDVSLKYSNPKSGVDITIKNVEPKKKK